MSRIQSSVLAHRSRTKYFYITKSRFKRILTRLKHWNKLIKTSTSRSSTLGMKKKKNYKTEKKKIIGRDVPIRGMSCETNSHRTELGLETIGKQMPSSEAVKTKML